MPPFLVQYFHVSAAMAQFACEGSLDERILQPTIVLPRVLRGRQTLAGRVGRTFPSPEGVFPLELCDECARLCAAWLKAIGNVVRAERGSEPDETIATLRRAAFKTFERYDVTRRRCGICQYKYKHRHRE